MHIIITVAGGSGSGKSYLSAKIAEHLTEHHGLKALALSMDSYYKNSNFESFANYDHPDAFNVAQLTEDLTQLRNSGRMTLRQYDYVSKISQPVGSIEGLDVLILEGLYPFYFEPVRQLAALNIFIDTHEEKRIARRIERDHRERSISPETNQQMLQDFVLDMHEQYVIRQKDQADVVTEDSELHHVIEALTTQIGLSFPD